jgi:hypothetical protein
MCQLISFKVVPTTTGLTLAFDMTLNSHADINGPGYECEWTVEDGLTVRVPPDKSDHTETIVKDWITAQFKDRDALIRHAAIGILEQGQVPNIYDWEVAGWTDKEKRLFACDCAEHTLPIYEKEYPDVKRPRQAIETARRFALGEATSEEMDAAGDAAWAAARAAVRAAARAAARDAARAAARAAAWDAAGDAAGDAARDAARAAEEKWQAAKMLEYLEATA